MPGPTGQASEVDVVTIDLHLRYMHSLGALQPYFKGLQAGRAMATRCPHCKRTWFPPRLVCPHDHADAEWTPLNGYGRIVSVTTGNSRLPLSNTTAEYTFALIALDGADNVAFGRIVGEAIALEPGCRVRLTPAPTPGLHPAQAACFVPDED